MRPLDSQAEIAEWESEQPEFFEVHDYLYQRALRRSQIGAVSEQSTSEEPVDA